MLFNEYGFSFIVGLLIKELLDELFMIVIVLVVRNFCGVSIVRYLIIINR